MSQNIKGETVFTNTAKVQIDPDGTITLTTKYGVWERTLVIEASEETKEIRNAIEFLFDEAELETYREAVARGYHPEK